MRALIKLNIVKPDLTLYQRHKLASEMRKIKLRVIGYRVIEVLAKVRK